MLTLLYLAKARVVIAAREGRAARAGTMSRAD